MMRAFRRSLDGIHGLVLLVLLLVGAPFVVIGGTEGWATWRRLQRFPTVAGMVVGNDYRTSDDNGGAYYPVVAFTPAGGAEVRFTEGIGSLPPDFAPGTRVRVLYDPARPRDARIVTWKRLWLVPALLTAVGILPAAVYLAWRAIGARRGIDMP